MKETFNRGWAKRLWSYVCALVLHDIKTMRPFGRWYSLIDLVNKRKEYSYMYSLFLRWSKTTSRVTFYPAARVHSSIAAKIFELEMNLPISNIIAFREVARLLVINEAIKIKVKRQRSSGW